MIQQLVEGISGYPGVFGFCVVSGILFPLPEDFPLIWAGVLIEAGQLHWAPTLFVAMVGVSIRDIVAYWIGRLLGDRLLTMPLVQRLLRAERIERAETMVREHGSVAVLIGRFLIGFRAPMFAIAGASRVPFRKFLAWNTAGMILAVPGVIWLGWFFGEPIQHTMRWVMFRAREVVIVLGVVGLGWAWWKARQNADT